MTDEIRKARRFLYFVPGAAGMSKGIVEGAGIGYGVDAEHCLSGAIDQGPSGTSGVVVVPWGSVDDEERAEIHCGFDEGNQKWWKCGGGKFWLGVQKGLEPGPEDLSRVEMCDLNARLELGDGNDWWFPVAKPASLEKTLPRAFGLSADGDFVSVVAEEFAGVDAFAERVFSALTEKQEFGLGESECVTAVSACLGVNYKVTEWECRALGLWTAANMRRALWSLVDWPTVMRERDREERQKKGN